MSDLPDFAALYDAHAAMLLRVVSRTGVPPWAVEDVAAHVWLEAWEKHATLFDGRNFRAWICEIARHRAISWLRRPANRQVELSPTAHHADPRLADPRDGLEAQAEHSALRHCVRQLNEQRRAIVTARLDGDSSARIGVRLGLTEDQVNRQMHAAKEQLRRCVLDRLKDDDETGDR